MKTEILLYPAAILFVFGVLSRLLEFEIVYFTSLSWHIGFDTVRSFAAANLISGGLLFIGYAIVKACSILRPEWMR